MKEVRQWRWKVGIQWAALGDIFRSFFPVDEGKMKMGNHVRTAPRWQYLHYFGKRYHGGLVRFYTTLFVKDPNLTGQQPVAIKWLFSHTSTTLSSGEIKALETMPTKKELCKALLSMAKGKSSGIDGLTSKGFQRCWHLIEDPYFNMIQQFWVSRTFYPQFNEGVLKLLPKKADKRRIGD